MNGMRPGMMGNTPENGQFSDSGLQTLWNYYIILQIMSQHVLPLLLLKTWQILEICQICQTKSPKSDRSICHCQCCQKNLTGVRNWSPEELPVLTGPSVRCQICQNCQNSGMNSLPWSVNLDTCQIRLTFLEVSDNLLIHDCCFTGGKQIHSSFPPLPSPAVVLGYLPKNPLFLYIRKRPRSQGEGSVWGWLSPMRISLMSGDVFRRDDAHQNQIR